MAIGPMLLIIWSLLLAGALASYYFDPAWGIIPLTITGILFAVTLLAMALGYI